MTHSLLSVFAAGIATLATPCILPMLPVYLSILLGAGLDQVKDPKTRFRLVASAALFVLGFSTVFTLLGLGASSLGAVLHQYRDVLLVVGAALIALFGLKYLGVLRIGWLDRTVQIKQIKTGSRYLDALVFGFVFALGWTPCVGPILGSVLTYTATATANALDGALHLFAYSMGVGVPLLVLSLLANQLVPKLRQVHRHLPKIEKVTGVAMLAVAVGIAVVPVMNLVSSPGLAARAQLPAVVADDYGLLNPALGAPSDKPRLVKFYTEDCPVCQAMKPRFHQLKQDCDKRGVEIMSVNLSDPRNAGVAKYWNVRAVPTIKLIAEDGLEKGALVGERQLPELRAAASQLMDTVCEGEKSPVDFERVEPACGSGQGPLTQGQADGRGASDQAAQGQCLAPGLGAETPM